MRLGPLITERRGKLHLTLRALSLRVLKEDGHTVSAQYIHDIERERRAPSPHVLGQLALALGIDRAYLASVAGHPLPEVDTYLREQPKSGSAVAALFARARATGFTDWDRIEFPKTIRDGD